MKTLCLTITGWGRTVGGGAAADVLQQAELPVVAHSNCAQRNSALAPVDESTMVCAGSGIAGQAGGCQGDSGGLFGCEENENGCCVEPSAGEVECAKPITIPSLLVSAVSLTGSIRKCLVAVVVVMVVEVVVVSLLYKTNTVL